jgi:hypothetical protein
VHRRLFGLPSRLIALVALRRDRNVCLNVSKGRPESFPVTQRENTRALIGLLNRVNPSFFGINDTAMAFEPASSKAPNKVNRIAERGR